MKGNRSLILSLALLFSALNTAQGNKDIAVRNSRRVKSPRVMDDIGCIFKYNTNSLCFTQNPPTLRAGWEFDQTYSSLEGVDFWKLKAKPYVEAELDMSGTLTITDIYYLNMYATVNQFMADVFVESYLFRTGRWCIQAGWEVQSILLNIISSM